MGRDALTGFEVEGQVIPFTISCLIGAWGEYKGWTIIFAVYRKSKRPFPCVLPVLWLGGNRGRVGCTMLSAVSGKGYTIRRA